MSTDSNRSASPSVFVRHPHSFVPISGQSIPPPPNWKPPPLPKDVDDSGSAHSSVKSNKSESVSSDGGYLSLPTAHSSRPGISDDASSRLSSSIPSPIRSKPMQELKASPCVTRIDESVTKISLPENASNPYITDNSSLTIDVCGSSQSESVIDVSSEKNDGEGKAETEKCVPDLNLDNFHAKERMRELHVEGMQELGYNLDAPSCKLSYPDSMNKDNSSSLAVLHEAVSDIFSDDITLCTDPTISLSKKVDRSNGIKELQQNPVKSINILELEEELDCLPIPEFPSLGLERELDTLPMSEFPAPEVLNNKESENFANSNLGKKDKMLSDTSSNIESKTNERAESAVVNSSPVRNSRNVVENMDTNLSNITNALKTPRTKPNQTQNQLQENSNSVTNGEKAVKCINDKNKTSSPIKKVDAIDFELKSSNATATDTFEEKPINSIETDVRKEGTHKTEEYPRQHESKAELARNPSLKYKRISNNTNGDNATAASLHTTTSSTESIKPAAVICRIKDRVTNERRNSLVKTLTRLEPYLLVASSPPGGIRSQRLAELGVSCVVHATTVIGTTKKGIGIITSHSDGIDILNANLEDGGNNFEMFDTFADKISQVQKKKGVALVISDESSPSINQR